jgi:starch synthase
LTTNPKSENKVLRILFLGAEADPFIKVGGLGDVTGSLPRSLRSLDSGLAGGYTLDVRLAIPYHYAIHPKVTDSELITEFTLRRGRGVLRGEAFQTEAGGVPVYLIHGPPFEEETPVYLYDTPLDGDRYTFFSLGALKTVEQIGWQPDIIHANDWHTAMALYALCIKQGVKGYFSHTSKIITVHNLPFMGGGSAKALKAYGLPASRSEDLPKWARHFPLPLGLLSADQITAVSPTYAQEIMTPEFGCGLQDFLQSRSDRISGILNGLDMDAWDPTTDPAIPQKFGVDTLEQRHANKTALLNEFDLDPAGDVPLFILIGRMDAQKGVDLALESFRQISDRPWQAILLGTGDPLLEASSRDLERSFPDRVRAAIRFDAGLARRMYAGADSLIMPSRYEPCGLAQMIAMRYGCIPIARATGGLKDTIVDSTNDNLATGILFEAAIVSELTAALSRAISLFEDSAKWQKLQRNGMQQDFSWERSASAYAQLYVQSRDKMR